MDMAIAEKIKINILEAVIGSILVILFVAK